MYPLLSLIMLALPIGAAHADALATASSSVVEVRVEIISQYLASSGCPPGSLACTALARTIAVDPPDATSSPSSPPPQQLSEAPDAAALTTSTVAVLSSSRSVSGTPPRTSGGNALLTALPALFVLNSLFHNASNGLLSPGPATLGNIIILYQLFYASSILAPPK